MASKLAGGEVVLDHGTFKADKPPLAPKRKLKIDRKKSNVEWQWAPFTNQAREDGAVSASCDLFTIVRHRRDSSPADEVVGGLIFYFERISGKIVTRYILHRSRPPPLAKKRRGIRRVPLRALQHEAGASYLY